MERDADIVESEGSAAPSPMPPDAGRARARGRRLAGESRGDPEWLARALRDLGASHPPEWLAEFAAGFAETLGGPGAPNGPSARARLHRQMFERNRAVKLLIEPTTGRIVDANPAACHFYGHPRGTLLSMRIADINTLPEAEVKAEMARARAEQRSTFQFRHQLASGEIRDVAVHSSPIAWGASTLLYSVIYDVTPRTRAEAALRAARARLAEARESERRMLAQNLHDGAVQQLLGISYQLLELRDERATPDAVDAIWRELLEVVTTLRGAIRDLRPPGLHEVGLGAALEGYVNQLREGGATPEIEFDLAFAGRELPEAQAIALFRIAQEALRNAIQHAAARRVVLSLRARNDELILSIYDDGQGFELPGRLSRFAEQDHFGLVGITERAEGIGGRLTIHTHPGEGTAVIVQLALAGERRDPGPPYGR